MSWIDEADLVAENPPTEREILDVERMAARKAKPRFFADENFPARAVTIFRELGARVETVQEAGRRHHPDENHIAYALENGLVLLSCDRDFLDNKKFPLIHCPAIFVFDFGRGTEAEIMRTLCCLGSVFAAPQFFDKWCKVDARRDSWIELMRYQNGSTSRTRYRLWRGRIQSWIDG
jgi:predicted nuclease of predicted toxin-antitoxin system